MRLSSVFSAFALIVLIAISLTSNADNKNLHVGCIDQPTAIMGVSTTMCVGAEQVYSIAAVPNADLYVWTLPSGWTGSSNTTSISAISNGIGGIITVVAIDSLCGSSAPRTLVVTEVHPPSVPICLVSVDSLSTHNIVVWEKPSTALIDSFLIFREITDSIYNQIGSVHYDSLSIYHDYDAAADPNTSFHRYKLATMDTCGVISELSDFHRTMHLSTTATGEMLWTWYDIEDAGNPVSFFNCYRDSLGNGDFITLSVLAGTENVWTDSSLTQFPDARYFVDVDWTISCDASRENVNTTRSNLDERVSTPVGIDQALINAISIYPNPSNGPVSIRIPSLIKVDSYVLWSNLGAVSYQTSFSSKNSSDSNLNIQLPDLAPGIYYLELQTPQGGITKKLVLR